MTYIKAHGERAVCLPMSFYRLPKPLQSALGGRFQKISFVTALDHKLQEFLNRCWAPNQFESQPLGLLCPHSNQGRLISHVGPFGILPLSHCQWPHCHPRRDSGGFLHCEGFCTARSVQDSGSLQE